MNQETGEAILEAVKGLNRRMDSIDKRLEQSEKSKTSEKDKKEFVQGVMNGMRK
ncbi:hypothetical protein DSM03_10184 [Leeuwenhoekiella aestuarii]|uniref:hypothetical protein n=1 Tax=Leeuwenhoekiella aestuarii TaxID=2249426 RepID=UPI001025DCF6|nr:hypothetical protein [Leeuwenhoekiella aestuarii]RXG18720.1 hypothetical protein DSM03_10184 [Leeuwenhoekiella aestuarii]